MEKIKTKITNINNKTTKILLALFSGILGFLAFPPFEVALLGWVCLVPLLFVIKSSNLKESFFYSLLSGLVFFGCLLYWLVNVTVPGMIILVAALSLFYGIFGACVWYVLKYSINLLSLPFVWVVLEYVRSRLFTGFPWGLLGYSQYKTINLIQIADVTGVYGVSFLIVIFNIAIFAWFIRSEKKLIYWIGTLILLIMSSAYGIHKLDSFFMSDGPEISVIQGNIPQKYKWNAGYAEQIIEQYADLTHKAAVAAPDLIVWPESSYPYLARDINNPAGEISTLASREKVSMLAGIITVDQDVYYNSAIAFNKDGNVTGIYNKTHLVPFGEYVPFSQYLSFLREYVDKPIGDFKRGRKYTLFSIKSMSFDVTGNIRTRQTNFYKYGVLICFEDVFPYIAREFVRKGAKFLINITNDAWFGETAAARQHLQSSVFRAIENRVPVIRAANTGISCFIDFAGRVSAKVGKEGKEIFVDGIVTHNIDVPEVKSYYTVYGDVFVYFCIFMMILIVANDMFFRKKRK